MKLRDIPKKTWDALNRRMDGWANVLSGLGTSNDRAENVEYLADDSLDWPTLEAMYRGDDVARRIVSIYPQEALRVGWKLDPGVSEYLDGLEALRAFRKASTWGRLFGCGMIVMGLEDGSPADLPLAATPRPLGISYLDVYARPQIQRGQIYSDRRDRRYGRAKTFLVTPVGGSMFEVHRSRVLIFGGADVTDIQREKNAGFEDSVLQNAYRTIRSFNSGYLALDNMLTDASQAVIKMQGLIAALAADGSEGQEMMATRAKMAELTRGLARALLLDAETNEEFIKVPTQFSGVPESIDRLANRLASCTGIPVTVLMGQAPAGLAATGDADVRNWYDHVVSWRKDEIEPNLRRLLSIVAPEDKRKIEWDPLWQPTRKEQAETDKIVADTDAVYEGLGAITPEEIAEARFGPGGPRPLVVNMALRRTIPNAPPEDDEQAT